MLLESSALEFRAIFLSLSPTPSILKLPQSPENFVLFRVAQKPPSGEEVRCRHGHPTPDFPRL